MSKEKHQERYFHRDLSWLLFNGRVIEKSYDEEYPILEQLRFLAIAASNSDEFFMVRVPALQSAARLKGKAHKIVEGIGLTHEDILSEAKHRNQMNYDRQYSRFHELMERLKKTNVLIKRYEELNEVEVAIAQAYFDAVIFPSLSPIGLDNYHATPKIDSRLIHLFIHLQKEGEEDKIAVLPLPVALKRLVKLGDEGIFVSLEEAIIANLDKIFYGWQAKRHFAFRVTYDRNPDFEEDPDDDIVEQVEEYLIERKKGLPSRIEISFQDWDKEDFKNDFNRIETELGLKKRDFYFVDGPLDLTYLFGFISEVAIIHPDWVFEEFHANNPSKYSEENIFAAIDEQDILLHHPYDSYEPIVNFLSAAAKDPNTIAIKQTLYRMASDSRVVHSLIEASKSGKQVTAVVELKARFDEVNNLKWVKELEEAGVFVIYGAAELKIHSKALMVVKKSGTTIKTYVHIATGNYNESTAKVYTDLSLFSCKPEYVQDMTAFFNYIAGYSEMPNYQSLAVSPNGIEQMILSKIDEQIARQKQTGDAAIFLKVNAITSKGIIEKLYEASNVGIPIELVVRGACMLIPDVPSMSENICVRSIIGRFLEHSRIYAFGKGDNQEIWLSSADTMTRNMRNRIEVAALLLEDEVIKEARAIIDSFVDFDKKVFFLNDEEVYVQRENTTKTTPQTHFVLEALAKKEPEKKKVADKKSSKFIRLLFRK